MSVKQILKIKMARFSICKTKYLFYAITTIIFYLLERQYMQVHEDISYLLMADDGQRICSLWDAMKSQSYDYFHHDGRFIVHSLVRWFCSWENKELYFAICGVMFSALIAGITNLVTSSKMNAGVIRSLATLLLVIFIPIFGTTFLGHISFVVNYLWTSVAIVWFLYCFQKYSVSESPNLYILTFFSIIAGSLQESFSIGIALSVFVNIMFRYKYMSRTGRFISIAFLIGACIVILAPGNFVRFNQSMDATSEMVQQNSIGILNVARVIWNGILAVSLIMITALVAIWNLKIRDIIVKEWMLYLSIVVALAFSCVITFTARQQLTMPIILTIILMLKITNCLYGEFIISHRHVIVPLISVILLTICIPIYSDRQLLKETYDKYTLNIRESADGVIDASEFVKADAELSKSAICEYTNIIHVRSNVYFDGGKQLLSDYLGNKISVVLPCKLDFLTTGDYTPSQMNDILIKESEMFYILRSKEDISHRMALVTSIPESIKAKLESHFVANKSKMQRISLSDTEQLFISPYHYYALLKDKNGTGWVINDFCIEE